MGRQICTRNLPQGTSKCAPIFMDAAQLPHMGAANIFYQPALVCLLDTFTVILAQLWAGGQSEVDQHTEVGHPAICTEESMSGTDSTSAVFFVGLMHAIVWFPLHHCLTGLKAPTD